MKSTEYTSVFIFIEYAMCCANFFCFITKIKKKKKTLGLEPPCLKPTSAKYLSNTTNNRLRCIFQSYQVGVGSWGVCVLGRSRSPSWSCILNFMGDGVGSRRCFLDAQESELDLESLLYFTTPTPL